MNFGQTAEATVEEVLGHPKMVVCLFLLATASATDDGRILHNCKTPPGLGSLQRIHPTDTP